MQYKQIEYYENEPFAHILIVTDGGGDITHVYPADDIQEALDAYAENVLENERDCPDESHECSIYRSMTGEDGYISSYFESSEGCIVSELALQLLGESMKKVCDHVDTIGKTIGEVK